MKKEVDSLRHKVFWLVLAVVVVLPLFGILTGMMSLELSVTTGKAFQTISHKMAGSELFFEVRNIDGLKTLTVDFLVDTKNMLIEFEEVDAVGWGFEGTVYSQFKVSSEDAEKAGNIKFNLKLEEEKLIGLGLNKDEVKLYLDGQELETELTDVKWITTKGNYVFYEATSENMGEFVIGKAKVVEVVEEEPVEEVVEVEPEIEEKPVVEQPLPAKENLFSKIVSFFKNLFS